MIGERIRERRKELGMTQDELANKVGVKKTSISNYEVNTNSPPEKIIIKLMEALNCDANYLFADCDKQIKIAITPHEERLIKAYRKMPEMHLAIDRLLGIEAKIIEAKITVSQKAARSGDGRAIDTVKMTSERTAKFENAETDDDI